LSSLESGWILVTRGVPTPLFGLPVDLTNQVQHSEVRLDFVARAVTRHRGKPLVDSLSQYSSDWKIVGID